MREKNSWFLLIMWDKHNEKQIVVDEATSPFPP